MRNGWLVMILLAAVLLPLPGRNAAARQIDPPELFVDAAAPLAQAQGDPTSRRERYVSLHPTALAALQAGRLDDAGLTLNLFDDSRYLAHFVTVQPGVEAGFVFSGYLQGEQDSEVYLALEGETAAAEISAGGALYTLSYVSDGVHRLQELEQSAFPPGGPSPLPPPASPATQASGAVDDDGSLIDILVVYTAAARTSAGSEAAIRTRIETAISSANASFGNSQIDTRYRLVHTAEVSYSESGFNWNTALDRLTAPADGWMDDVHTWRDEYAADLVVLVVGASDTYCGLGWLMDSLTLGPSFEAYAFSLVAQRCLSKRSLAHETGHNLGAHHDVDHASGIAGAYPYSYGYQNQTGQFYTIMAYSGGCSGCTQINYWSHPDVTYRGYATGTAGADNHRTLNNTRTIAAGFRNGPEPPTPGGLSAASTQTGGIQLNWTDAGAYETGFRLERRLQGATAWETAADLPANTTSFVDSSGLACESDYEYRLTATSGNGASPASAPLAVHFYCPPAAPASLNAAAHAQLAQVALSWVDASSNESGFRLERSPHAAADWQVVQTLAAGASTFTDTGVLCSTIYDYRLFALNGPVVSAASNTAAVTTAVCAPQDLQVNRHSGSQSRLDLAWGDASPDESGFAVQRWLSGSDWLALDSLPANTTAFTDAGLTCGSSYTYRVGAYRQSETPVFGGTVSQTTHPCGPPMLPVALSGRPVGLHSLRLTWTDVDDETQYEIQRSPNGVDWAALVSLPAGTTGYTDEGLLADTIYFYRARAVNAYLPNPDFGAAVTLRTYRYLLVAPLAR